ncbi:hypothetical protein JDV02_000654 [Purpureocillium takamizusanense]|uniref:Uncharacterized protein n=1 Tax=Purpureocillium takamizusanense TaxID=2060973 RepID=A0A9Q8V6M0_9HYPO|nr:uncharacterized protein JDV02_000654 [Purpureocillium takamizusanense]UNI13969.1 hypothetical protein JDV02_000654 [Purpureocillium takamizusanense]
MSQFQSGVHPSGDQPLLENLNSGGVIHDLNPLGSSNASNTSGVGTNHPSKQSHQQQQQHSLSFLRSEPLSGNASDRSTVEPPSNSAQTKINSNVHQQALRVNNSHYPPLGLRSSPNFPVFIPYGAPNVDRSGKPSPSYPPVGVATVPVPAYGNPTTDADSSAQLVAVPITGEQFDAYAKITGETQSPSLFLDLEEPTSQDKTESAQQSSSTNSLQSKIPIDPRIEHWQAPLAPSQFTQSQTTTSVITPRNISPARQNIPTIASRATNSQAITAPAGRIFNTPWPQPCQPLIAPQAKQPTTETGVIGRDGTYCPQGSLVATACGLGSALPASFGASTSTSARHDIKVDNSRNAKKNKNPNSNPSWVYTTPVRPNASFGPLTTGGRPLFTYTQQGQLTAGRAFTSQELRAYVDGGRCFMWVQQAPSQCAGRMDHDDKKCRWASCPINARSISSGWLRVALDEFPGLTSDGTKDPFKVAGVLHLWCFEQIFDPMEFHKSGRLLPEVRHLPKETSNVMAINRETDRDIVPECYNKWFQDREQEFQQHGPVRRPRQHEESLSYALIKYHVSNQTTARHRARATRNQDKATGHQKTIDVHVGDLGLYARIMKNCRATAKAAQSQQMQEAIMVDDDDDPDTTLGDTMGMGWSPVAEEVSVLTEPDKSPASGLQMPPPSNKSSDFLRASTPYKTPSKSPATSRRTTSATTTVAGSAPDMTTRQGKNNASEDVDMSDLIADGAKQDAPRFDLLNPASWKDKTPAPASPIHEFFNPLQSPLTGIVPPVVMQTPLKSPVVRGSIVARGLTAQQAILAQKQELQRRKSVDAHGVVPPEQSTQVAPKRKRDDDDTESGCVSDDMRPAKMQHMDQPSPKRKRDEDDISGASPSPKRRRSELDLTAPNLMAQHQENVMFAQTAESVVPDTAQNTQQTTEAATVAANSEPEGPQTRSADDAGGNLFAGHTQPPELEHAVSLDSLFEQSAADLDVDSLVETFEWPQ